MKKLRSMVILFLTLGVISWYGVTLTNVFREDAVTTSAGGLPAEEYYDQTSNRNAARRIGEIPGVNAAAVLNRGEEILAGITVTETEEMPVEIKELSAAIIKEEFGEEIQLALAIGGSEASDIMELSYYLREGMSARSTDRRFLQLFRKVQQKQTAE